jgi:hypothetical protein
MIKTERILVVDFTSTKARGKELAPSSQLGGGLGQDRCGQISGCITSAHRQWGGQEVPSIGGDPCHHYHAASGVCSLASD